MHRSAVCIPLVLLFFKELMRLSACKAGCCVVTIVINRGTRSRMNSQHSGNLLELSVRHDQNPRSTRRLSAGVIAP